MRVPLREREEDYWLYLRKLPAFRERLRDGVEEDQDAVIKPCAMAYLTRSVVV